jgi:mRNA-degrading endonuclease toxin of MazEF toxin-antitoxin module
MGKTRPVLIVQPAPLTNLDSGTFVVAPLSSKLRVRAVETLGVELLRIKPRDELTVESVVLIDQLRTISPLRFKFSFRTQLNADEMAIVQRGIAQVL